MGYRFQEKNDGVVEALAVEVEAKCTVLLDSGFRSPGMNGMSDSLAVRVP
jgi:hypothetical protein